MKIDDLRAELTRAAASEPPGTRDPVAAVRRRVARHRRRFWASMVAAIAAATLVVVVALGTGRPRATHVVAEPRLPNATRLADKLAFTDGQQGWGYRLECPSAPPAALNPPVCRVGLIRSDDGGATWRVPGRDLTATFTGWVGYPLADLHSVGDDTWIYGTRTFVTHDGGRTLVEDRLDGVTAAMASAGGTTWVVVRGCPPSAICTPTLMVAPTHGGRWRAAPSTPPVTYPYLQLVRTTGADAYLLALGQDPLFATHDGARRWERLALPARCERGTRSLAASGAEALWLLCGDPAPDEVHQNMGLYRSRDGGRGWQLVAETGGQSPGAGSTAVGRLPNEGTGIQLVAGSTRRLWLVLGEQSRTSSQPNPLLTSSDGGRTWSATTVRGVASVVALDSRHAWALMADGRRLFRTEDGQRWERIRG